MDYGIFNVRTDVNACDCTRGCTDTVRDSALKVDSRKKIPCRTGESNLRRRRAGPIFYQLSYTPTDVICIAVGCAPSLGYQDPQKRLLARLVDRSSGAVRDRSKISDITETKRIRQHDTLQQGLKTK